MTVISVKDFFYVKSRPSSYKAKDAAYRVGGNKGAVLAAYPRPYPKNAPQKKIAALAKKCDIKSGISKSELQKKMKECVTSENYAKV